MKARHNLVIALLAMSFFLLLSGCHKPTDPEDNFEITLSATSGKPGELLTVTTNVELQSYQDYEVHFGTAVSPLLQTSDTKVFDIMVPPTSAGNVDVYMKHKTDDKQSNKVTFNMQPLPQTGLPAGAYTTELIDSQTEMVDIITDDFVSELDGIEAFGTNNPTLITNELTRARGYLQTFRNSLSQLSEADRLLLDQLLFASDLVKLYKQTNRSLSEISQSKTEYTGQYMLVALDGVSALISLSTRVTTLAGFIASIVTGGAAAAPAVGIVFALKTVDNVIDGFVPTDLDYIYVDNAVNGNVSVPANGTLEVEFKGRFVPQSNPITESFDTFLDVLFIEVGAGSDVMSLIGDYFIMAGFSLANNVSNLQNDWESVINIETRINPEFYEDGWSALWTVMSDWTGIDLDSGFIQDWVASITGTPYQVTNSGIAHFNSDNSSIEGIQLGTTPITYGGYRFKSLEGWLAGIGMFLGIEWYQALPSSQMQVCNIVVTDEVFQVSTPTFTPPGGSYTTPQNVSINCTTSGASIKYTTDGTEPTESSSEYSGPINVNSSMVIKAKGFKSGWTPSATGYATYAFGIESGLITYYPLTNDASDFSGQGNNGVPGGAYTFVDGAISLTGSGNTGSSGGHVVIPLLGYNQMTNFTINIWVNEHAMTYSHGEAYIFYGHDSSSNQQISIGHWGSGVAGNIAYRVGNATALSTPFIASYLDNWVMHTIVFQNGTVRAYVNSALVGTSQGSVNITSNYGGLARHWFSSGGTTSTRFTGKLDEVRIYNRALIESEIQQLYSSGR